MNTTPPWPGLSAVIHHTIHRHTLISLDDAAQRMQLPMTVLCQWADAHGISIHRGAHGDMIAMADIESALTRRPPQSRPRTCDPYRQ